MGPTVIGRKSYSSHVSLSVTELNSWAESVMPPAKRLPPPPRIEETDTRLALPGATESRAESKPLSLWPSTPPSVPPAPAAPRALASPDFPMTWRAGGREGPIESTCLESTGAAEDLAAPYLDVLASPAALASSIPRRMSMTDTSMLRLRSARLIEPGACFCPAAV